MWWKTVDYECECLYVEELWFRKYEYLYDEELWIMNVNVLCDDLHLSDIWIWKRFWASVWDIISKTKQAVSKGIILDRVYHILTDGWVLTVLWELGDDWAKG